MTRSEIEIRRADLDAPEDAAGIVSVLDSYARDPMGAGEPLATEVRESLPSVLRAHPTTVVLLAGDRDTRRALGVAICFLGITTFRARRLLNVHDLAVVPDARGRGIGRLLLRATAQEAMDLDCCKVTLEVLEGNDPAQSLYTSEGFARVLGPPGTRGAEFWELMLP